MSDIFGRVGEQVEGSSCRSPCWFGYTMRLVSAELAPDANCAEISKRIILLRKGQFHLISFKLGGAIYLIKYNIVIMCNRATICIRAREGSYDIYGDDARVSISGKVTHRCQLDCFGEANRNVEFSVTSIDIAPDTFFSS